MLKRANNTSHRPVSAVAGFTLVEMLVSVALVLIMMVLFAQVFQESTRTLAQQRGIAENDQRARMLSSTIRDDLDGRTFRDVFPFRGNEDTRQLGHSLSRRAGYFEIDEGLPNDDTDDVLQFTASVNIRLQYSDNSPFIGKAGGVNVGLSATAISGVPSSSSITVNGNYTNLVASGSNIYIVQGYQNNGKYTVSGTPTYDGSSTTTIPVNSSSLNTSPTQLGFVYLSEADPDFDDGVFGNQVGISATAEVCYYLRNGVLYRRVLLIRDPSTGTTSQPAWSTGIPLMWNGTNGDYPASGTTTFWRDYDYSGFYLGQMLFHSTQESLSNSSQSPQMLNGAQTMPLSLGMPHLRFGHSISNGFPQDASTTATLTSGGVVTIGRFNLQECSDARFGYPGRLPADPVSGTLNTNPFDRQNIQVDPSTGLVVEYSNVAPFYRRGEDILLSNVLSFDVKVWDPFNSQFVDIGDSTLSGPFNPNVGVLFDATGNNVVGGRLNSTYGANGHFRFDTWHPAASVTGNNLNQEPPYYTSSSQTWPPSSPPAGPYVYNEPPFVPAMFNPNAYNPVSGTFSGQNQAFPLSAIQITINYRDVSSNQVRQMTLVQSLVDRNKPPTTTTEPPEE